MGFGDKVKKFVGGKSKEKFGCQQGPDGKLLCESFREFEDGTKQPLAEMQFEFDAHCHGVATHMEEHESGALDKLEKKAFKRIQDKCKSIQKPGDY